MRITILSNLLLSLTIVLTATSCIEPLNDNGNIELSCKESISEITFQKEFIFLFKQDTVITQANVNDNYYNFKCKDGKRLYRKKKFRLYPLKKDQEIKQAELIVELNSELKENKLIGVFSKIITLNNEPYLFQEEMGVILDGYFKNEIFYSDDMLVKHDNEYISEDGQTYDVENFTK